MSAALACAWAEVPLSRGQVALVDLDDYETVMSLRPWHATPGRLTFYARKTIWTGHGRAEPGWQQLRMHSVLTGWPLVDHINGNGLDNRRSNLRLADRFENARNRNVCRSESGYLGVYRNKRGWRGSVIFNGRRIGVGTYPAAIEAAVARDEWIRANAPSAFWRFNFPRADERGRPVSA